MGSYVPNTPEERQEMLRAIGLRLPRALRRVPASMYLDRPLDLPSGMSELEVRRTMTELAGRTRCFPPFSAAPEPMTTTSPPS